MTQDDNAVFTADLSNPDLLEDGKIALRRENIHLNRMKFIWNGACYERLRGAQLQRSAADACG